MGLKTDADFNLPASLFEDPYRTSSENMGPHLLVLDNFYDDPMAIRRLAQNLEYQQYAPPLAAQVGIKIASQPEYASIQGRWLSSALFVYGGVAVSHPFPGYRFNPNAIRLAFQDLVGATIPWDQWDPGGDGWNGAFHLREGGVSPLQTVHHHYSKSNIAGIGWSGVAYLSPDAPESAGTSIWQADHSGKCVGQFGEHFDPLLDAYSLVLNIPNRFNRLVLFRENVLHKVEHGFGEGTEARLTQTFFFTTASNEVR